MKIIMQRAVKNIIIFCLIFLSFITEVMAAKLVIVIDDIGYRAKEDAAIYAMPKQIAVAIIPVAPHAAQRNQQAQQQGRDVLIHMPMQPQQKIKIEQGGLTLGMAQDQVLRRVEQSKSIVSAAIGLNNHMGSAATTNTELMTYLMNGLRQHNLFFLDSKTAGNSVAMKIAKSQGISALERHIFLDKSDELADVQRQFQLAIQYARKHGTAIVIGHPRKNTIAVLQAGLANLPSDIQLVSIGSLWRNEKVEPTQPFIFLFGDMASPTNIAPYRRIPLLRGTPE